MATQQRPDDGRSYETFPALPGRFVVGPLEPNRRAVATPRPVNHYAEYERKRKPPKGGTNNKGSVKGIRGERPAPIVGPLAIDTANDLGAAIRQERRAIGLTAEEASTITGVWGTALAHMERGKDVKLSTLLRVLSGLGLQLTLTRRAE